jgi:hypothetical protein
MNPHIRIGVAESGGVHRASTAARFKAWEGEATEKYAARRINGIPRLFNKLVLFITLPFLR